MKLTQQQLETHLWGAANILSLMFYKRRCDQWENEAGKAIAKQERQQGRAFAGGEWRAIAGGGYGEGGWLATPST